MGRPTKIKDWQEAAEGLLNDQGRDGQFITFLTDEEFFSLVNDSLPAEKQIAMSTFYHWQNKYLSTKQPTAEAQAFLEVLKKARIREKLSLFASLLESGAGMWQKYAWIIERKFKDWNIRDKVDQEVDSPVTINFVREAGDGAMPKIAVQ